MKLALQLGAIMEALDPDVADAVFGAVKAAGGKVDDQELRRLPAVVEVKAAGEGLPARTVRQYVSTRSVDRIGEVVVPGGWDLGVFRKAPQVMWGHNYSIPPIGSDQLGIEADDWGLLATTTYADTGEGTLANVVWALKSQGHLRTSSVGFVPLASTRPGQSDWDKALGKVSEWKEIASVLKKKPDAISMIVTKALLIEHSDVSLPMNTGTDIVAIAKDAGAQAPVLKALRPIVVAGWDAPAPAAPPAPPDPAPAPAPHIRVLAGPPHVRVLAGPPRPVDYSSIVREEVARACGRMTT